jgi:hypothetical protein
MKEIIQTCPPIQNIIPHLAALINSKNSLIRLRVSQYFEIILRAAVDNQNTSFINKNPMTSTLEIIDSNSEIIDYFLVRGTDD